MDNYLQTLKEKWRREWEKEKQNTEEKDHFNYIKRIIAKPDAWAKEEHEKVKYKKDFTHDEVIEHLFIALGIIKEKNKIIQDLDSENENLQKEISNLKAILKNQEFIIENLKDELNNKL